MNKRFWVTVGERTFYAYAGSASDAILIVLQGRCWKDNALIPVVDLPEAERSAARLDTGPWKPKLHNDHYEPGQRT